MTDVIEHMGADQVSYGPDAPPMEGMEPPRVVFGELDGVSIAGPQGIPWRNTADLDERRPAWR